MSIDKRNRTGLTEEGALEDINEAIKEISHLNATLPGVFIDSYAAFYPDDEKQQEYFKNYAMQMWNFANSLPELQFYTIEDILEDLNECRVQNDCLNEVLEGRLSDVEMRVSALETEVSICGYTKD